MRAMDVQGGRVPPERLSRYDHALEVLMSAHRNWAARVFTQFQLSQTPIILPETAIVMGLIAMILGRSSAAAFADFSQDLGVRAMGFSMVLGGVLINWSYIKYDAFKESLGLVFAALGTAIYGISVFIALGKQGLITGVGFVGMSTVFVSRVYFMILDYRSRRRIKDSGDDE
jgi:hypothetical protein